MDSVEQIILQKSKSLEGDHEKVGGYDFNNGINYDKLLDSYAYTGFQATNFGAAVREINKMVFCKTIYFVEQFCVKYFSGMVLLLFVLPQNTNNLIFINVVF